MSTSAAVVNIRRGTRVPDDLFCVERGKIVRTQEAIDSVDQAAREFFRRRGMKLRILRIL